MSLAAGQAARRVPHAVALTDDLGSLNWQQVDDALNRIANGLLAFPFGPARRAAVFATNSAEAMLAYLGCLHGGVSVVPVNSHLKLDELVYILTESEAELLFVGPETAEVGLQAAERVGKVRVIGWRCVDARVSDWGQWLSGASPTEPADYLPPRPYLQFTSGTTGFPKAIDAVATTLPPADTASDFFATLRLWAADSPTGPNLIVGPLYFNASLSSVRLFAAERPQIVMTRFDPEAMLDLVERHRVETVVMVPTHFKRLLSLPDGVRAKYDISSLRRVIHTGAACPPALKAAMIAWFGPVLIEAYGGTESGTTNMIASDEWLAHPGSVGRTLDAFELLIYSDDGALLGPNEAGQIFFRDRSGRGIVYRGDPDKTRAAHREPGVFTLGDVGYQDAEGYLYITDRVSDMIVSGGVNIYPAEIEQVLLGHPDVADAVVIGVPNVDFGEEAKALVVPRDAETPIDDESLLGFLRERLAGYKCPRSINFVADVGRNAAGKVNKRDLKKPYWPSDRMIG